MNDIFKRQLTIYFTGGRSAIDNEITRALASIPPEDRELIEYYAQNSAIAASFKYFIAPNTVHHKVKRFYTNLFTIIINGRD